MAAASSTEAAAHIFATSPSFSSVEWSFDAGEKCPTTLRSRGTAPGVIPTAGGAAAS